METAETAGNGTRGRTKQSIARIERLVAEVTARFGAEDDAEQAWLVGQCAPELAEVVAGLSVQALHLLDAIEEAGSINVVGLARATSIPKGTVSKALHRLTTAGLVRRGRLPGNRKEVHVELTDAGREVQRAHRSLHEQMGEGISAFLARYSPDELAVIITVLDDLARMPRDGLRFRPDLLDDAARDDAARDDASSDESAFDAEGSRRRNR